jgi:hypothetical protein
MSNVTCKPADSEGGLLRLLAELSRTDADGGAPAPDGVAARLAALLGDARAAALLKGCAVVHEYLTAEVVNSSGALDEEHAAVEASRRALLPAFQCRMQQRLASADAATAGRQRCTDHDSATHSHGLRSRSWLSTLGPLRLRRRYSLCPVGGEGLAPAERAVGPPTGKRTAHCDEVVTAMATTVPHGMAERLLGQLVGLDVSEHAIQDAVETRAAAVTALESAAAQACSPVDASGRERHPPRPADAVAANKAPRVAYLETDGVLPMTRELEPERCVPPEPGARGGQGRRYKLAGREVKNAVLYTEDAQAAESPSRGCLLQKTYVSPRLPSTRWGRSSAGEPARALAGLRVARLARGGAVALRSG